MPPEYGPMATETWDLARCTHATSCGCGCCSVRESRSGAPVNQAGEHSAYAAQEKPDFESPVLPSYSIPKALIRVRFASAIVRSDPTG